MVLTIFLFILGTNIWIIHIAKNNIYDLSNVPFNEVALVLGTSKLTSSGKENRFFKERMYTVAALHRQGSIRHILLSGDNGSKYYNEPVDMLNALNELEISDTVVSLDYAGFRTLDSVVRSKEVFGQESITIVTQEFHCYRSLFIAKYFGINAVAVSADDGGPIGNLLAIREVFARTMSVLDLYILQRKPRYLGERIELIIN
ncbi:MAG: ElyC/SanA/YdcF family protein [Bacteroidota bacterium]